MKRLIACSLAAVTLGCVAPVSARAAVTDCDTEAGDGDWLRRFDDGTLGPRDCALRALRTEERSSTASLTSVRSDVADLSYFYERRARRQQIIVDTEAGLVFVGALGSALATGAGTTSQRVWAYATFAPAVASQIHANEPTRDLFHGAVQALALMSRRYDLLEELNTALGPKPAGHGGVDCDHNRRAALSKLLEDIRKKAAGSDREAFEREVERLQATCDALSLAEVQTGLFRDALDFAVERQPRQFAREVLALDQDILKRDRDLRYSPVETIGAIIASPLRTLDSVLTGENAQAALNTIKTAQAFSGLDQRLGTVRLPPLPTPVGRPSMSDGVRERARGVDAALLGSYDAHLSALRGLADRQAYTAQLMQEAAAAASATDLTFDVDAASGRIRVGLAAPTP